VLPIVRMRDERPERCRIFSRVFPKVSSNHCFSDSTKGLLPCCEPHVARQAGVFGFLSRWHTTPRCLPDPQPQPRICVRPRDRKTFSVRAPSTPLPECVPLGRSDQSPRNHPLAVCRKSCSGEIADVRPCDPVNMRTIGLNRVNFPVRIIRTRIKCRSSHNGAHNSSHSRKNNIILPFARVLVCWPTAAAERSNGTQCHGDA
jgi:hypothetical protein